MRHESLARMLVGVAAGLALGACGGGGGGGGATVSFAFQDGSLSVGESDGPTDVTVVLKCLVPALTSDVTVEVVDLGTGTASSALDYAAFGTQLVTFPSGSVDGATQVVTLDPQDDALVDAPDQTVLLGLQNPVGGVLYGTTQLTATVTDVDSATIGFATTGEGMPETNGTQSVALELDAPGLTLEADLSVRVTDLHTGTAVAPGDYGAFTAQTVTFPAGSGDGAVLTVDILVKQDATTEGDETVELGLASPSPGCTLGGIVTHTFTIEDDDAAGNAAFVSSEGATGTENGLAYDELVSLGTQTVGAGPNAGTLLRVANAGGQAMNVGAPHVAGTNLNDFAVDVESSSFTSSTGSSGSGGAAALPAVTAPFAALPQDDGPGVALRLDPAEIARLRPLARVTLADVVLPDLGPVTLELRRERLPLTDDAKLVIDGAEVAGGMRTLLGDLQLWKGSIAGMEGSRVFLAFTATSAQGFFELPRAEQRYVQILDDGPGRVRLMSEPALAALGLEPPAQVCAGERFVPGVAALDLPDAPGTSALTVSDCRLALESDYQFFQKFNSSLLLANYVTSMIAAISDQYVTDVQTTLSIAYLGIHTAVNDGWDTEETANADASDLLDEFRTTWGTNWSANADLAHFLSGDSLGGGIAYVDVLCSPNFGFGVSSELSGNINWATWTGQAAGFTWDFVVVAHELGHNFGSQHTHDYCPPLDKCYTNCTGTTSCTRGTLMSYCHLSCGGLGNIDLYFHPVNANIMRANVNGSCLDSAAMLPGDFVQYRLRFNPLTTIGSRSAYLEFTHDAPNTTQPFRVQLGGTAN